MCGEAEGHAAMVICDTCERPYHLQCCFPPRSTVPSGEWHCHQCSEAYSGVEEFRRNAGNELLFLRDDDTYHYKHAVVPYKYMQRYVLGARQAWTRHALQVWTAPLNTHTSVRSRWRQRRYS